MIWQTSTSPLRSFWRLECFRPLAPRYRQGLTVTKPPNCPTPYCVTVFIPNCSPRKTYTNPLSISLMKLTFAISDYLAIGVIATLAKIDVYTIALALRISFCPHSTSSLAFIPIQMIVKLGQESLKPSSLQLLVNYLNLEPAYCQIF